MEASQVLSLSGLLRAWSSGPGADSWHRMEVLSSGTNLKCISNALRAPRKTNLDILSISGNENNRTSELESRCDCVASLPCQGEGTSSSQGVTHTSASVLPVEITVTGQLSHTGPSIRKLTQDHLSSGTRDRVAACVQDTIPFGQNNPDLPK